MSYFDEFWKVYPNKQGKKAALTKWKAKKLDLDYTLVKQIVGHVEVRAKMDKKWLDGYIPMPTTFLNQERWDDEYDRIRAPFRGPEVEQAYDPYELSEGVKGMARHYQVDVTGLTEQQVCEQVWQKKGLQ